LSWLQKNNSKPEQSGILAQNFSATRKSSRSFFFDTIQHAKKTFCQVLKL
jgi:hypothetical protein